MDFPSKDWFYNDLNNFDTAPLFLKEDVTLEVYTQLRPDHGHFRAVICGTGPLQIDTTSWL